jgi:C-terminal processing protease CtpA/Prc
VIESVDTSSIADQNGIKPGDELLMIGTVIAAKTRLFVLRRLLTTPGWRTRLTIKRGEQELTFDLVLAGFLGSDNKPRKPR